MHRLLFLLLTMLGAASAHSHEGPPARPELALGRSAQFDFDPPAAGSYRLPAIGVAADGAVLDIQGQPRRLARLLAGRISIVIFTYTRCTDVCPQAMGLLHTLHEVTAEDPALRNAMQLVTISFDPENDTPAVMAEQAAAHAAPAAAPWHFLTTSGNAALQPLLDAYGQPVARYGSEFAHPLRVFLVDREQRIRNIYSMDFLDPRLLATDVRTLLAAEGAR